MTHSFHPAPLKRRFMALLYESLFVIAVAIVAGIFAGIFNTLLAQTGFNFSFITAALTTFIFLFCWWFYFKINWIREGQTLPMRVWHIGLRDISGAKPTHKQLRMRFLWASIFVLFIPLFAYYFLRARGIPVSLSVGLAILWWILPWGFALMQPQRQFLYDYLAGTALTDTRPHTPKD